MPGSNDNQASAPNKTLMDQERAAAILSANVSISAGTRSNPPHLIMRCKGVCVPAHAAR